MKTAWALALGLLASATALAQAPEPKPEFEVASVKPFSIAQTNGGSVTLGARIDGAQVRMTGLTLRDLLSSAYRVKLYQITGPEWMATERYDINAKLPAGVSSAKLPEMTQSLLSDRFGLRLHREKKEMPVYALLLGKAPLKLIEVTVDRNAPAPAAVEVSGTGGAAGIAVNLGNGASYSFMGGKFNAKKVDAPTIAAVLERFTDRPVVDLTELKGTYDFEFTMTPEDTQTMMVRAAIAAGVQLPPQALRVLDNGGNPLVDAVEQLGLRLESRKMPVEMLIVDQVQKVPTEN